MGKSVAKLIPFFVISGAVTFDNKPVENLFILYIGVLGTDLNDIIVVGGGSKSDLMMQIISDLFGLPVQRLEGSNNVCLDVVICCL